MVVGRRSSGTRHNFALTAPVGAVRAISTQPELGPQQKCEKYRTLPTDMEIPQVSSVLVIDFDFPKEWLFGRSS